MDIDAEKLEPELALTTTQKMADSIKINSEFFSVFLYSNRNTNKLKSTLKIR